MHNIQIRSQLKKTTIIAVCTFFFEKVCTYIIKYNETHFVNKHITSKM